MASKFVATAGQKHLKKSRLAGAWKKWILREEPEDEESSSFYDTMMNFQLYLAGNNDY